MDYQVLPVRVNMDESLSVYQEDFSIDPVAALFQCFKGLGERATSRDHGCDGESVLLQEAYDPREATLPGMSSAADTRMSSMTGARSPVRPR